MTPMTIEIKEEQLADLRRRLAQTRWPEAETCHGWEQGVPLAYTRELTDYWQTAYDWRRFERRLNDWENFRTEIDGIDIHFIHRRSPEPDALPLIVSHGWPGSVVEFHKIIEPLADPASYGGNPEDAFHLVVPSLPGYGFSGKPVGTGTSVEAIGRMWGKLMAQLGYDRYLAQGGDWGAMITQSMGITEQQHCAGLHITMPIVAPDPATMDDLTARERAALDDMAAYKRTESAYARQQSTRPQTLGYGLADSPVGQMAWVVEKFYAWTDCEVDGVKHPEHAITRDELLDNVMLYWLNNCGASSGRLYWESFATTELTPIDIPVGCSIFPRELFRCSRRWAERRFSQLIHWNELERGGHFAALEQPDVLIDEIRRCFRPLR